MYKFFAFFVSLVFLLSCIIDNLNNLRSETEMPVYVSGFVTNDSMLVRLNYSVHAENGVSAFETTSFYSIPDKEATINVYEDDVLFDTLRFAKDSVPGSCNTYFSDCYYYSNKKNREGKTYRLVIDVKGCDKITTSAFLPYKVPVLQIDTTCFVNRYPKFSNNSCNPRDTFLKYTNINIRFIDPVLTNDYYRVAFKKKNYKTVRNATILPDNFYECKVQSHDGDISYLFSDKNIQGKKNDIKYCIEGNTDSIDFCLYSLNEDAYKYNLIIMQCEKYLSETCVRNPIYSNVSNGNGIFIGYSATSFSIPKKKDVSSEYFVCK